MYTIYYFIYSFLFRCTDTLINITSIVSCIIVFTLINITSIVSCIIVFSSQKKGTGGAKNSCLPLIQKVPTFGGKGRHESGKR